VEVEEVVVAAAGRFLDQEGLEVGWTLSTI